MKPILLATASSLALTVATTAVAAPPASAVWNWAGPYVGINLGVGLHRSSFYDLGDPTCCQYAFPNQSAFWSPNNWGITAGGQAGYNWQFGNVVAGVEADINWIDGKSSTTILPSPFSTSVSATARMSWYATARGRLGWAFSRSLIYVTGGLAVARVGNEWGYIAFPPPFLYQATRSGPVFGAGIEHALTQHWSVRLEGLHANFGTSPIVTTSVFGGNYQSKFTHSLTVVRGALNWKW